MEIGAFFILVIVLAVVAALGGIVYVIAAKLRHKELSPDTDERGRAQRPAHHAVDSEQSTDFVGTH